MLVDRKGNFTKALFSLLLVGFGVFLCNSADGVVCQPQFSIFYIYEFWRNIGEVLEIFNIKKNGIKYNF